MQVPDAVILGVLYVDGWADGGWEVPLWENCLFVLTALSLNRLVLIDDQWVVPPAREKPGPATPEGHPRGQRGQIRM